MARLEDLTVGSLVNGLDIAEMELDEESIEFILAIVEVDGQNTRTVYLKEPFKGLEKPSFMEVNWSFSIAELSRNAEIIYQE